jgi:pimeloyl-ACP methyl ester carboxylesterase
MAFSAIYDLVIDDRDVRIYSNGTGQPVLMLPDLGSSAATWETLTGDVVENDRQLVAVDLPGTGHCDPVRGSDLAAFVDHTKRVVEHLTNKPIALVGCGFGGYLAVSVAAQDPQLVARLVLENPAVPPRSGPPVSARMPAGMAIGGALTTLRRGRIKQNAAGFARAKAVLEQLAQADPHWWGSLSQITARTLIVGSGTDAGDRAQLDLLSAAIPGSTRADLTGARRGHASDPKGFADATMPFLCAG